MRSYVFYSIVSCFLLISGCSLKDDTVALPHKLGMAQIPGTVLAAHPEAEQLTSRAGALWQEDICSDPEEAVALLNRALELEPDYPPALALRGLALSELDRREEAFDDLTSALRRAPTARMYAWRGLASLRGGLPEAARRDAEYALRKESRQPDAWNVLGAVALDEGNTSEACASFEKGCEGGRCRPLEAARRKGVCK